LASGVPKLEVDCAAWLLHGADPEVEADGGKKVLLEASLGVSEQET